jgi:hypothetical protein
VTLSLRASAAISPRARLTARLRAADVMSLPEPQAAELIRDLERDPLFRRLLGWEGGERVVRRRRFAGCGLSRRFHELNESLLSAPAAMDVQGFLDGRRPAAELIRRMGAEDFERYFLHQEDGLSREGLSQRLGLTAAQVEAVADFVLAFSARAEFFRSAAPASPAEDLFCVGRVEGDAFDGFHASYSAPHLARGRYAVDQDAWTRVKAGLPAADRRRAAALLRQAGMLALRADAFHRVLAEALREQRAWLAGGGRGTLRILSQREAGRRLGLSSSTVCRAVAGRAIVLPWGEEARLADLFPQKKRVLQDILSSERGTLACRTDGELRDWLLERHRLRVPRRTVNYWRRRLAAEEAP